MWMRIRVRSPSNRSCSIGSSLTARHQASQGVAHAHAQHHGHESAKHARSDVERGLGPFSLFQHAHGIPAKGGKGGESSHQPDGQANAQVRVYRNVVESELPDHAKKETSQQIDGERPGRKDGADAILNHAIEAVASQGPQRAKYDQKYDPQSFFL